MKGRHRGGLALDLIAWPVLFSLQRGRFELVPEVAYDGVDGSIALVCPLPSEIDHPLHANARTRLTSSHHVGARSPDEISHLSMLVAMSI